jgi:hypothetical protein
MALTRLGPNQAINLASNVTGALPVANGGTALTSGFINGVANPGKIGQVLRSFSNTSTTLGTTTYSSISLSQAITCSATSSKVLIMGAISASMNGTNEDKGFGIRIRRDSTSVFQSQTLYHAYHKSTNSMFIDGDKFPFFYLDSPSSSSSVSYSIYCATWNSSNVAFQPDANQSDIILMEVLA